jgi:ATP-dependent helicase/DNAse subunit B
MKIKMVNYGLEWQMLAYIDLMDRHLKSNFEKYERTTRFVKRGGS